MAERRAYSLAARLALITAAWSAVALLVTGLILAELFRRDAERSFDLRLQADLVNLVREANGQPAGAPVVPGEPLGPLFREPFSGWAWQVRRDGHIVAQSGSLGPLIPGVMEPLEPPGATPADFAAPGGIASRGAVREVVLRGEIEPTVFAVARPRAEIDDSIAYFSKLLLWSLGAFGVVMFAASLVMSRIVLAPVTRLKDLVRRMREGEPEPPDARGWPREIAPVVEELAGLSQYIERLVERSRNQSSDLAHALKTPLSIIRQAVEQMPPASALPLADQLGRIERSLDWHLTRRRLAGPHHGRVGVAEVAEDVIFAMSRLFHSRNLDLQCRIGRELQFIGDTEDLHEILGNVIENACKWARRSVSVEAALEGDRLELRVEDDGPGIPEKVAEAVFARGARLDQSAPGHGHGLAIVRDIVRLYGGAVAVGASTLGGASIRLSLPGAAAGA